MKLVNLFAEHKYTFGKPALIETCSRYSDDYNIFDSSSILKSKAAGLPFFFFVLWFITTYEGM